MNKHTITTIIAVLCVIVVVFGGIGSLILYSPADGNPNIVNKDNGVVIRGYFTAGSVKNTNGFSVTIRCVWQFSGERTIWISEFPPNGIRYMTNISHQHGFYIIRNGKEIGFIKINDDYEEKP
jgi:hypothetical protein